MKSCLSFTRAIVVLICVSLLSVTILSSFASSSGSNGPGDATDQASSRSKILYYAAEFVAPSTLDPAILYDTNGGDVMTNCYETLVAHDGEDPSILVPRLATDVPTVSNGLVTDGGYTYRYLLRNDVQFHDGSQMTSEDVVYSFARSLRIKDPNSAVWIIGENLIPDYYNYPAGEFDANGDLLPDKGVPMSVILEHIWAVDQYTVQFNLTVPFAGWNQVVAYSVCSIVSKDFVELNGGLSQSGYDFMSFSVCGTGPFMMTEYVYGDHILFSRNDNYWSTPAELEEVLVFAESDYAERVSLLKNGDVDIIQLGSYYRPEVAGDPNIFISEGNESFTIDFLGLNQNINLDSTMAPNTNVPVNFFSDPEVRKAFACAFDYEAYNSGSSRVRLNGVIPAGMFGYDPSVPYYNFDVDAVRSHLQNATFFDGTSWTNYLDAGFSIDIFYNVGNAGRQYECELLKQGLEAANPTAIHVTITELEWSVYLASIADRKLPLFYYGWAPDYCDPHDYVSPFYRSTSIYPYRIGYSDPYVDMFIDAAALEQDAATREGMYSDLSWYMYDQCLYIWTGQGVSFQPMRSWVQGYTYNAMFWGMYFYPMSLNMVEAPGAPTNLSAVVSDSTVLLSWSEPSVTGSDPIDYYEVHMDGSNLTTTTETFLSVGGLENGVYHDFSVLAHSAAGYGPESDIISAAASRMPDPPTGLTAVPGDSSVTLNWTAPAVSDTPINYYAVWVDGIETIWVTGLSKTLTGLTNGVSYTFAVSAHNDAGLGGQSNLAVATPVTTPGAPTGLTATVSDAAVDLSWTAPASDGGAPIEHYVVYMNGTALINVTGTMHTVSGLLNGVTYSFSVRAYTAVGLGPSSTVVYATPYRLPGAPTDLAATPGNGNVTLTWTAPADLGDPGMNYYVVYKDGIDIAHVIGTTYTATGLTNGVSYSFYIRAHNFGGTGAASSTVSAVPVTVPGQPRSLTAQVGDAQVALDWDSPLSNGGSAIDYYIVYQNGVDVLHTVDTNATLTGLINGMTYNFTVAAHNGVGAGPVSDVVAAMPFRLPGTPTGLEATPGNGSVTLTWDPPSDVGGPTLDYYVVYKDGVDILHTSTLTATITGLTNGVEYEFSVRAHNVGGLGPESEDVHVVPADVPGSPRNLIGEEGDGNVTLSWDAPLSNGGAAVDYYLIYMNGAVVAQTSALTIVIDDLDNGVAYIFNVTAHNAMGESAASASVELTPYTIPNVPTALSVEMIEGTAIITWTAPSDLDAGPVDHYTIFVNGVAHGETTDTIYLLSVQKGKTYSIEVIAVNDMGESSHSQAFVLDVPEEDEDGDGLLMIVAIIGIIAIVGVAVAVVLLRKK